MLEIRNLSKDYQGLLVLRNLNIEVKDQEIVAIVGPSGCGKSTLLNLIAGTVKGFEGTIENHAEKTGYVFQEDRILPWLNVYDNIRIVRQREDGERIHSLIKKMHLDGFESYYPEQLSGGMRQRCGIARAFYFGSELLLMDEPFKSLDVNLRMEMLGYLLELWEEEKTAIVFVTHDIEEALMTADRILVMKNRPAEVVKEVFLPERHGIRRMDTEEMMKLKADLVRLIA